MRLDTLYVSIGNTDNKLGQAEWAEFWTDVQSIVQYFGSQTFGEWLSLPNAPFQNACWAFCVEPDAVDRVKSDLAKIAARYRQESIAMFEGTTTFILPASQKDVWQSISRTADLGSVDRP